MQSKRMFIMVADSNFESPYKSVPYIIIYFIKYTLTHSLTLRAQMMMSWSSSGQSLKNLLIGYLNLLNGGFHEIVNNEQNDIWRQISFI